jgi:hypothetical protein
MGGKKPQDMDVAPGQVLSCKSLNGFPVRYDIFFHDDKLLVGRAKKVLPKLEMACVTSDFAGRQRSPEIPDGIFRRIAQRLGDLYVSVEEFPWETGIRRGLRKFLAAPGVCERYDFHRRRNRHVRMQQLRWVQFKRPCPETEQRFT